MKDEIINATIVEAKADDRKFVMFGWCMDGNDEGCIGEFPGHRCKCECHVQAGSGETLV